MSLTLREIQQLTLHGLHNVHADYSPSHKRRAFSATPDDEFGGRLVVEEDKFVCYAILTRDQFEDLKDHCNGLGIWLSAKWKPFGRLINKYEYELWASNLIERAEWTKRKAENTVRCTIELIGEDARNPTQGIVEVVRQLADQLEAKARMNGHAPVKYQLVVEGELTRGRAHVRRQSDKDQTSFATETIHSALLPAPEALTTSGLAVPAMLEPLLPAPIPAPRPEPPTPPPHWLARPGCGHLAGFGLGLPPTP